MNFIWSFGLIFSLILFLFSSFEQNNILAIASSSIHNSLAICVNLAVVYIFWCGILEIVQALNIHKWLAKKFKKIMSIIFKHSTIEEKEKIATSLSCNMLGLGNASVPSGINALEEMQKNKNNGKNSTLFIIFNCISIQIIPTTIMSLYISNGGQNFFKMWLLGLAICFFITVLAICINKLLFKKV